MKTILLAVTTLLSSTTYAKSPTPVLFYSSSQSGDLSANVLEFLKMNPIKGGLLLRNVGADRASYGMLVRIGKNRCGFGKMMQGGVPMLFDGKRCHTSDVGVIEFLKTLK